MVIKTSKFQDDWNKCLIKWRSYSVDCAFQTLGKRMFVCSVIKLIKSSSSVFLSKELESSKTVLNPDKVLSGLFFKSKWKCWYIKYIYFSCNGIISAECQSYTLHTPMPSTTDSTSWWERKSAPTICAPWLVNHCELKSLWCQKPVSYPHAGILHPLQGSMVLNQGRGFPNKWYEIIITCPRAGPLHRRNRQMLAVPSIDRDAPNEGGGKPSKFSLFY